MSHRPHLDGLQQLLNGAGVNARRLEQFVGHTPVCSRQWVEDTKPHDIEYDPPHKGEAVGVEARGGEADHDVARADGRAIEQPRPLHDSHGETRQVVLAGRV